MGGWGIFSLHDYFFRPLLVQEFGKSLVYLRSVWHSEVLSNAKSYIYSDRIIKTPFNKTPTSVDLAKGPVPVPCEPFFCAMNKSICGNRKDDYMIQNKIFSLKVE